MKNNYSKNLAMLKSCRKFYTIIFWTYFISCVPTAVIVLIYGTLALASSTSSNIFGFTATMILLIALFVTGLLSVYKKETKFTYLPIPVAILLIFMNSFDDMFFLNVLTLYSMGYIHLVIAIASSIILTFTNKKYHWLEQQEGFPYFNERFEEKKNSLSEYENNNPYQNAYEKYKNNSSGKMDEI